MLCCLNTTMHLSRIKTALGAESEVFNTWHQGHAGQCVIKYDGSFNASFNIILVML